MANTPQPAGRLVPFANSAARHRRSPPTTPGPDEPPPDDHTRTPAPRPPARTTDTLTSATNCVATHHDWLMFPYFCAQTNWKPRCLPAAEGDAGRPRPGEHRLGPIVRRPEDVSVRSPAHEKLSPRTTPPHSRGLRAPPPTRADTATRRTAGYRLPLADPDH